MNERLRPVLAAGALLAAAAAANAAPVDYSANAALASPTISAEGRRAMQDRIEAVNAKFRASHGGQDPEQFGLQCCQVTQIPAAAFHPRSGGSEWPFLSQGYIGPVSVNSDVFLWAPVELPTGVQIVYMDFFYFDDDDGVIFSALDVFSGGTDLSGPPTYSVLAQASSSGTGGYGYVSTPLTYTVNNNVALDPQGAQLAISVSVTETTTHLQFKAVDLWWMRQVSPPPVTATFSDVPTDHPQFQFIEALAASGITVGCGNGKYCPDDTLTRGQMAVFLAKALGLYWQY